MMSVRGDGPQEASGRPEGTSLLLLVWWGQRVGKGRGYGSQWNPHHWWDIGERVTEGKSVWAARAVVPCHWAPDPQAAVGGGPGMPRCDGWMLACLALSSSGYHSEGPGCEVQCCEAHSQGSPSKPGAHA